MNRFVRIVGLALASIVTVFGLCACMAADDAVLSEGETRTSSSGAYTVEFLSEEIDGLHNVYPVIKDCSGAVVWQDDQRYVMRCHPVGVVWQEDEDVLWLLSSDIGDYKVAQFEGTWVKKTGASSMPADIKRVKEGG